MVNWDFDYVEKRRDNPTQTGISTSVVGSAYRARRPVRINPWLCIGVVLLCLWGLKVLVFG